MAHLTNFELAPRVVGNRLANTDQIVDATLGSWTVTSGNATLTPVFNMTPDESTAFIVMQIDASDTDDIVLTCDNTATEHDDITDYMTLMTQVKSTKDLLVTMKLERFRGATPLSEERTVAVAGDRWNVVRGEPLFLPRATEAYVVKPTITIANHAQYPVYLYRPVIYPEFGFRRNTMLREIAAYMPRVFLEKDREQSYPRYPLLRLLDIGTGYGSMAIEQYKHFFFRDPETGSLNPDVLSLSGLIEPSIADDAYLPWLGSITGNELLGDSPSTTPWANFPSTWQDWLTEIDTDTYTQMTITAISNDGAGEVTVTVSSSLESWCVIGAVVDIGGTTAFDGQFEITSVTGGSNQFTYNDASTVAASSEATGTADFVDNSWEEIERYQLVSTTVEDFWRWQLENSYYARKAGTLTSIQQTLELVLTGTKSYSIDTSAPFYIVIQTLTSETLDGITGEASELILGVLENVRPVGNILTHECVTSL